MSDRKRENPNGLQLEAFKFRRFTIEIYCNIEF